MDKWHGLVCMGIVLVYLCRVASIQGGIGQGNELGCRRPTDNRDVLFSRHLQEELGQPSRTAAVKQLETTTAELRESQQAQVGMRRFSACIEHHCTGACLVLHWIIQQFCEPSLPVAPQATLQRLTDSLSQQLQQLSDSAARDRQHAAVLAQQLANQQEASVWLGTRPVYTSTAAEQVVVVMITPRLWLTMQPLAFHVSGNGIHSTGAPPCYPQAVGC